MLVSLQLQFPTPPHPNPGEGSINAVFTLKWNPLIELNEQSAFCNMACCILKKVLEMNPYNSQA
jgi:hypothetical protein